MKYLLQAIQAQRASIALSDTDLRQLITDVQKGRDSREEFNESIERVLSELRAYTDHSAAFLSKVSKRDAPDYYDVIKNPMDIGTMQKKVKAGAYKNKKQFAHDLDLIWDNCLVYNSDPSHPLRRNVHFMRKKANHLLNYVHDKNDVRDALREWEVVQRSWAAAGGEAGANAQSGATNGMLVPTDTPLDLRQAMPTSDVPFEQRPALLRDPWGMSSFAAIDASLARLEREQLGLSGGAGAGAGIVNGQWPDPLAQDVDMDLWTGESRGESSRAGAGLAGGNPGEISEDSIQNALKGMRMQGPLHLALTTARVQARGSAEGALSHALRDPSSSSSDSPSSDGVHSSLPNGSAMVNGASAKVVAANGSADGQGAKSSKGKGRLIETVVIPSPLDVATSSSGGSTRGDRSQRAKEEEGKKEISLGADNLSAVDPNGFASAWWDSVGSLQLVANGAPALPRSEILLKGEAEAKQAALEKRQAARKRKWFQKEKEDNSPEGSERMKRVKNKVPLAVMTLKKLRRTHQKLGGLIQANSTGEEPPEWVLADTDEEETEEDGEEEEDGNNSRAQGSSLTPEALTFGANREHPFARLSPHGAREGFLHVSRMLMANQGLHGSHRAPLEALANMGIEIIANLGRTLRGYSDRYAQKITPDEMIKRALQEVVNTDAADLEGYVRNRVERHCSRLEDMLRKVKAAYESQMQQNNERQAVAHEAMFEDGADGLVAGNFADEIGDDFFGFKELGLEQELGMHGLSVPSRLFRGLRGQGGKPGVVGPGGAGGVQAGGTIGGPGGGPLKTSADGAEAVQFVPPEPFILLDVAGISAQIGLLGAFFREKLREHKRAKSRAKEVVSKEEMENLPDDEDAIGGLEVKKSTRVPPTGKLPKRRMWERPSASAVASTLSATHKATDAKGTKSKAAFGGGEKGSRKESSSAAHTPSKKVVAAS